MSRLGRNISANLVANGWSTVLALLLTPLYVSLLGVESYGLIGFYMSWVALLGILDTGISATAVRETAWLSARPEEAWKIPSLLRTLEVTYWGIILTIGVVLLVVAARLGGRWFQTTTVAPDAIRTALLLMVVSLVLQVPSGLYVGGLMGLQRQVECSALMAFFGTIRGLGAVAVLIVVRPDIRLFFLWHIVASALQTAAMRWSLLRRAPAGAARPRFSVPMLRSVRTFAGGMSLVTALSLVVTQADKMILSRLVSLESFGLYMLAWTVASGLMRIATPLVQAFGPRLTELVARDDGGALARQVGLAAQLTSALVAPPAAILILLAHPILYAWTGNPAISTGAAPLLSVMTAGTLLSACSYPALSLLYSQGRLKPVVAVNVGAVVLLLPVLVLAVTWLGAVGAAASWGLYGLVTYVAYQWFGLRRLRNGRVVSAMLRDFAAPAMASFAVAAVTWYWTRDVEGRLELIAFLSAGLMAGWAAAVLACRDLLKLAMRTFRWDSTATPSSA